MGCRPREKRSRPALSGHDKLLALVNQRVSDGRVLGLIKQLLKAARPEDRQGQERRPRGRPGGARHGHRALQPGAGAYRV